MMAAPSVADADEIQDAASSDAELRIGNIMPYTGLLAAFATIGKAEAAYFDMVTTMAASTAARSGSSPMMTVPIRQRPWN